VGRKRDSAAFVAEARREIARSFEALPIFQRPRGQALYHYVAVLEVEALKAGGDAARYFGAHRSAVESSFHAIPAVVRQCAPNTLGELRIDRAVFGEAQELFVFSHKLDQVQYSLALADRGQLEIHVAARDLRIAFAYASPEADSADSLLRTYELTEKLGTEPAQGDLERDAAAVQSVRRCLEGAVRAAGPERIAYEYTPDLIARVSELALLCTMPHVWELPPGLRLGSFSLGDLRRFWAAVLAMSTAHQIAHQIASGGDIHKWPIGTIVNARKRDDWITLLSSIAALPSGMVSELFNLYLFDLAVSEKTPIIQPFLEVAPDDLCAPSLFLAGNDIERNFLKLVNRHPGLRRFADTIGRAKEPLALSQLEALFPEPAFRTRRHVALPGITDADLVIYERSSGFALIVQHKWLIAPDTVNESSANDEQLGRGVQQGRDACDYWRKDPAGLRAALALSGTEPITAVEGVVVCRGAEPTGFMGRTSPPVITEGAFRTLLAREPSLRALCAAFSARPDQAATAKGFLDTTARLELAGYEFVIPVLAK
jgi:hypothetical protein